MRAKNAICYFILAGLLLLGLRSIWWTDALSAQMRGPDLLIVASAAAGRLNLHFVPLMSGLEKTPRLENSFHRYSSRLRKPTLQLGFRFTSDSSGHWTIRIPIWFPLLPLLVIIARDYFSMWRGRYQRPLLE